MKTELPSLDVRRALQQRPSEPVRMYQRWDRLAFLHWRVPPEVIAESLPEGLRVDTHEGEAWIGIVPFSMCRVRPKGLPAVAGLSSFLEINLRTYVVGPDGSPGVWFYSLDAANRIAVALARRFFHLPYFHARMEETQEEDGFIFYRTKRRKTADTAHFRYRGVGEEREAAPGSLEFFLVERYALFARKPDGRIFRGLVHHPPYRIQDAEAPLFDESLLTLAGLPAQEREPDHILYSSGVTVDIFGLHESIPKHLR